MPDFGLIPRFSGNLRTIRTKVRTTVFGIKKWVFGYVKVGISAKIAVLGVRLKALASMIREPDFLA